MPELVPLAEVVRSGFVESLHFGSAVALAPDGTVAVARGQADAPVLPRSSAKPFQALACLLSGARLPGPRLAIAAGSHTGEDFHVRLVTEMLAEAGLDVDALGCPADWPEDEATRHALIRDGRTAARERMNCSGKHAAMLAAAVASGWETGSYLDADHPVQRKVRAVVEELSGEDTAHVAVDGCGAPLFGVSLTGLARAARGLVVAAPGTAPRAVADAMREHPEYVGGTGHVNTTLMRALPGAVAKGGAEGVLVVALATGHAAAVKVIDGSPRATTAIALAALRAAGGDVTAAADLARVPVLGGGVPVGEIHALEEER
ncbi:L-asparaginase II [Streptosporangium becharense]|uniref:L-asparaginase II n=1 Tax=Streptosporangium becharense TaxID=1816182 RepID=A0A7W9IME4_9ACTN|nr:asparaginase [Streptosporangium becharense]MBB2911468.1 L-asparaginase II [Streptosporangium becharense]MBB5822714.1 L-asparaginase II [Streptosporangium becharense]